MSSFQDPRRENLKIREDGSGGVFVDLLSEHVVCDTEEVMKLIQEGARLRATSKTRMNKVMTYQLCSLSSRPSPLCAF